VRVPTRRTLLDVCMTRSYHDCTGYQASSALPPDA
jgi:hypothetical protein